MNDTVRPLASDPLAELPVKNSRYIKDCAEIYLAHRGITHLAGFERFVNLESLWINNNHIRYIENLSANFRIRELYAQCNHITDLPNSCIGMFKFLIELQLFDNAISDLDATLEVLAKFRHLEQLSLFRNPVAEEPNYRIKVISQIPSLRVLDNRKVSADERSIAHQMIRETKRKERAIANGTEYLVDNATISAKSKAPQAHGQGPPAIGTEGATRRLLTPEELVRDRSACVQLLRRQVFAIQRAEEQQQRDKEQERVSDMRQRRQAQRNAPIPLPNFLDFTARRRSILATATTGCSASSHQQSMDEWQIYRLARLIDAAGDSSSSSNQANDAILSRLHVRATLEEMERQAGWRLINAGAVLDELFPTTESAAYDADAAETEVEESPKLVSRDEAMRALTGRSRIALANDSGSFGKPSAPQSSATGGKDESDVVRSTSSSNLKRRGVVVPVWEMCSSDDCRSVARSAQEQLDQLSAQLSLLQGRSKSSTNSDGVGTNKDGEKVVKLYQAIMAKAALASRLLSLAKSREATQSCGNLTKGGTFAKGVNGTSSNGLNSAVRGDSIRLVTYPEPPEHALKQNLDDDVGSNADPEAKAKLLTAFGLKGARYDNFMKTKRAQVHIAAVWSTYNI
jgi:hypothetical protein